MPKFMSVLTEVIDPEAVINQLPYIDGDKGVVLIGCSQGGFVSALTATTGVVFPGSLHPRRCPRRENDVR